jgi:hypothetical protein
MEAAELAEGTRIKGIEKDEEEKAGAKKPRKRVSAKK